MPRQRRFPELDGLRHMCLSWAWRAGWLQTNVSIPTAGTGARLHTGNHGRAPLQHQARFAAGEEAVHLCPVVLHCTSWLEEELRTCGYFFHSIKKTPLEFGYFRITVRHPLHALTVLKLCISEAARGSIFILLCWALSPFLPVLLLLSACKTNYSKYSLIRARLLNSRCVFVCTC